MAEIVSFIDPKAQAQIDKYIKDINTIATSYGQLTQSASQYNASLKKQADAVDDVDEQTKQYNNLLTQLNTTNAKLAVSESNLNKEVIKAKEQLRLKNKEIKDSDSAYKQLNNRLGQARQKAKDLAVQYGQNSKQFKAAQKEVRALDKEVKNIDASLGLHQRNVGNYTSALGNMGGAIGSAVNGFMNMTRAAIAFIATPIGAVIGALGLAIGAVANYFKSSEEGQNAWNKIMRISSTIVGNLSDAFSALGKALLNPVETLRSIGDWFSNTFGNLVVGIVELTVAKISKQFAFIGLAWEKVKDIFTDNAEGIEDAQNKIDEANKRIEESNEKIKQGVEDVSKAYQNSKDAVREFIEEQEREIQISQRLADIEAERDKKQRKLIVDQEKLRAQSRELRLQAEQAEGAERIRLLQEAFAIEDELARRRTEIAETNLMLKREENKLSDSTKEDLMEEAELEAELFRIQQERLKLQRTLQTQINTERNKQLAEQKKESEEADKELEKREEDELNRYLEKEKIKLESQDLQAEKNKETLAKLGEQNKAFAAVQKARGLQQAIRDGYAATIAAFKDTPGPFPIRLAASIATGVLAAKNIQGIIATPAFAKGTDSTPSGTWLAGEAGREMMIDRQGNVSMIDQPTLFSNESGARIFSNADTERIMAGKTVKNQSAIDSLQIIQAIRESQQSVNLDKRGVFVISKKGSGLTRHINDRYRN